MPRANRSVPARARHKKVLDAAKGYRGRRKNVYRIAKQAVMKAATKAAKDALDAGADDNEIALAA